MFELRSDSVCYVESVLLQKKRRNQETSEEATTVAQAKNDGYLDKMGRDGSKETESDLGCILEVKKK